MPAIRGRDVSYCVYPGYSGVLQPVEHISTKKMLERWFGKEEGWRLILTPRTIPVNHMASQSPPATKSPLLWRAC